MGKRINRDALKRCIKCERFFEMDQLVGKAFPAGPKFAFYLCINCWRKAKEGQTCQGCGKPITLQNVRIRREKDGSYTQQRLICVQCETLERRQVKLKRRLGELAARYPHIVRMGK